MQQTAENPPPLPTTPEDLYARLDSLGIAYTVHSHPRVFTVEESAPLKAGIPGVHCRNLFLRDRNEAMALVVAANETRIDLKKLAPVIGLGRLSFGSAERLWRHLGVRPGSVCPFAIINDKDNAVRIVLDAAMMKAELVNYHPLENDRTVGLPPAGLVKFVESCGHRAEIVDLSPAAPDNE
jgi:Ala-tRNA(Pro) deacylase